MDDRIVRPKEAVKIVGLSDMHIRRLEEAGIATTSRRAFIRTTLPLAWSP